MAPVANLDFSVLIEPLAPEDGGGFVAVAPDLPGCMSDGATAEEALASIRDAISAWLDEARSLGRPIPAPSRRHVAAE
jgi:antitoxin HicB